MRIAFFVTSLVLYVSLPALAQQTPAVEVSAGYPFLRDQETEESFHGWVASVAWNVNRWLGIAGEVGGYYETIPVLGTDIDLSVHSFLAGPRFSVWRVGNVTPFAQLVVGPIRRTGSVLGETESALEFALQPGGGVDLWLRPNFGIRVGGDYRRIFGEDARTNAFRFHVGIALGVGVL